MYRGQKVGGRERRGHTSAMLCRSNALLYDSESIATKSNSIRTSFHSSCGPPAHARSRSAPKVVRKLKIENIETNPK